MHTKLNSPQLSPPMEGCPQDGVVYNASRNVEANNNSPKEIITTIHNQPIYRNFIQNLPYNPNLKPLLKDKRKAGILSEVLFWQQVHKNKFHHIDFDRQRIIGNYIVDFYVKTLGLVIEIDGSSHDHKHEYDEIRQHYLESLGLMVYRIQDFDMKKNCELVMIGLENYIIEQFGDSNPSLHKPPRPSDTPPKDWNCSQDVKNTY